MGIKWIIYEFVHIYILRDLIGPFKKRMYAGFGSKSRLYKPYISDKFKRNVVIGDNTIIGPYSRIQCYPIGTATERGKLIVGSNCRIGNRTTFLVGSNIHIGDGVLIASDVLIASENHSIDPESDYHYMSQPLTGGRVKIGGELGYVRKLAFFPESLSERSVL